MVFKVLLRLIVLLFAFKIFHLTTPLVPLMVFKLLTALFKPAAFLLRLIVVVLKMLLAVGFLLLGAFFVDLRLRSLVFLRGHGLALITRQIVLVCVWSHSSNEGVFLHDQGSVELASYWAFVE